MNDCLHRTFLGNISSDEFLKIGELKFKTVQQIPSGRPVFRPLAGKTLTITDSNGNTYTTDQYGNLQQNIPANATISIMSKYDVRNAACIGKVIGDLDFSSQDIDAIYLYNYGYSQDDLDAFATVKSIKSINVSGFDNTFNLYAFNDTPFEIMYLGGSGILFDFVYLGTHNSLLKFVNRFYGIVITEWNTNTRPSTYPVISVVGTVGGNHQGLMMDAPSVKNFLINMNNCAVPSEVPAKEIALLVERGTLDYDTDLNNAIDGLKGKGYTIYIDKVQK